MPFFMDWMVQSKKSDNWIVALFDAIVSARVEYQQTEGDLIILGNCERNYCDKFDVIFNFQDADESLPLKIKDLKKLKKLLKMNQH